MFRLADGKYNSGIFHLGEEKGRPGSPDLLAGRLEVDDDTLKGIIRGLYNPNQAYDFSIMPPEILGQVYEQFLGKVIRITESGERVKVEDKPEVKKAGGVYYTPSYVVDHIVRNSVGLLLEGATPETVTKLRIVDPSCGSGSFLIGAYQFLLDWHLGWYAEHGPENHKGQVIETEPGRHKLTLTERKRILLNNIFGVDIDPQAVEVTKLSLLLKVLERATGDQVSPNQKLFQNRALPDLDSNVKCGNSLIEPRHLSQTLVDDDTRRRTNAFDWKLGFRAVFADGGFDAVIGNPPYGMVSDELQKQILSRNYQTTEGRFDNFELFVERGIQLVKGGGLLGFIIPSPFLTNVYSRKLRRHVLDNTRLLEVTNFAMPVFKVPTVHTCIIVLKKASPVSNSVGVRKKVQSVRELEKPYDYEIGQSSLGTSELSTLDIFFDPASNALVRKLTEGTTPLGSLCHIRQCIKTGDDDAYVAEAEAPPGNQWKLTLRGKGIGRYTTVEPNLYLKYGPWLARNWKNKTFYETPKIAVRETGKRIIATLDLENRYFLSSLYAIYPKSERESHGLSYFLGILNSKLATFYLRKVALELTDGAFTKVRTNQLGRLPLRTIDFESPEDAAFHERVVKLVDHLLKLNKRKTDLVGLNREILQREIDSADAQLDEVIYQLYGLDSGDQATVEASLALA
jgi:type I restriction-modification system DNA methylase subunit